MLSLIRKILQAIKSYDTVLDRLGRIESTLTRDRDWETLINSCLVIIPDFRL